MFIVEALYYRVPEVSIVSGLRIIAAILMVISAVALFALEEPKWFAPPLILGNLLVLFDEWRKQRR